MSNSLKEMLIVISN